MIGAADRFADVRRHQRQLDVVPAMRVLDEDARARRAMLRHLRRITSPQPDLVALQSEIACSREGTIAATEYRDLQGEAPSLISTQTARFGQAN